MHRLHSRTIVPVTLYECTYFYLIVRIRSVPEPCHEGDEFAILTFTQFDDEVTVFSNNPTPLTKIRTRQIVERGTGGSGKANLLDLRARVNFNHITILGIEIGALKCERIASKVRTDYNKTDTEL
jgi:hypothetical protein